MSDDRDRLRDVSVTLNGEPARIVGFRNPFATVRTVRATGPSVEFAWATVQRVVSKGGDFHTQGTFYARGSRRKGSQTPGGRS